MAGPNLELFRFSMYLFFPLAIMVHFGDPQWYHDNVLPYRDKFFPQQDKPVKMPRKVEEVRAHVEELRAQRTAAIEAKRLAGGGAQSASMLSPQTVSLRPGGQLGVFSTLRRTGARTNDTASWRETWDDARRRRVV